MAISIEDFKELSLENKYLILNDYGVEIQKIQPLGMAHLIANESYIALKPKKLHTATDG